MKNVNYPQKVVNNAQMKQLDEKTINEYLLTGLLLMERASLEVYNICRELIRKHHLAEVVIFVGPGNNGGDGLAAARHLEAEGIEVKVVLLAHPDSLRGDAFENYNMLTHRKVIMVDKIDKLIPVLRGNMEKRLIIDAIFGTGIRRPVEGIYAAAIRWINEQKSTGQKLKILSIDIPSGVHGDSGRLLGEAVKADITVAFQLPKVGNVCYPGAAYNGELKVVSIGIPQELIKKSEAIAELPSMALMCEWMPVRPVTAHKGTFGSLLIIGGVESYSGAGVMAAMAAQRSGVGLIKTAVRKSVNPVYEQLLTEVVTIPLEELPMGLNDETAQLSKKGLQTISHLAKSVNAVVAGPGWGNGDEWADVLQGLISMGDKPLLLDADALNLLKPKLDWVKERKLPAVLTPHPGEMSRLTGISIEEINDNRVEVAASAAKEWKAVVVLKGAGTIIASPDGDVMINNTGNAGMATAGSGDVLAGVIGALLAQGMNPYKAAVVGCWLHGTAGDIAAAEVGELSLIATDMIKTLPQAITRLHEKKTLSNE